jgi:hypothetical protein
MTKSLHWFEGEMKTYRKIIYYNNLEECKETILQYKQTVKEKQKIFIFGEDKVKDNKIIHKIT